MAAVAALSAASFGQNSSTVGPSSAPTSQNSSNDSLRPFDVRSLRPVLICFPPLPPPLDRAVARPVSEASGRFTAPPELAAYVSDPFYAPLSTWLIEGKLSEKLRARLFTYRTTKANLLTELRSAIEHVQEADAATRRRALEEFAREQTPRLVELEREAEQLRADLVTNDYDWRNLREWELGDSTTRGDTLTEVATTLRAYIYYQNGIGAGQRRLLREIFLELANARETTEAATAAQPYLFFSPEPARVLLPEELPPELATKVASYQAKKSALKAELFETVRTEDRALITLLRSRSFRSLTERQAGDLAELERIAEEIRRGLAELPSPTRLTFEAAPLPPVLTGRIEAARRAGIALQKATIQKINALRSGPDRDSFQISYQFGNRGLTFAVIPMIRGGRSSEANTQLAEKLLPRKRELETIMTAIADDFGRQTADLVDESNAIGAAAEIALGRPDPKTVAAAISAASRNAALKESAEGYREYRLAVFEPGLSPEQRRLLFAGALAQLDLPLPLGEFQPIARDGR